MEKLLEFRVFTGHRSTSERSYAISSASIEKCLYTVNQASELVSKILKIYACMAFALSNKEHEAAG